MVFPGSEPPEETDLLLPIMRSLLALHAWKHTLTAQRTDTEISIYVHYVLQRIREQMHPYMEQLWSPGWRTRGDIAFLYSLIDLMSHRVKDEKCSCVFFFTVHQQDPSDNLLMD